MLFDQDYDSIGCYSVQVPPNDTSAKFTGKRQKDQLFGSDFGKQDFYLPESYGLARFEEAWST
jgi:hypothetical protein